MRYTGTLIAVTDMEKSKQFYKEVLGLEVIQDFKDSVVLTEGIILQTVQSWSSFIQKEEIIFENNSYELYFEEDEIDNFIKKLKTLEYISYIHPLIEHRWGQRAVRFYDLDKHIIEVGENITAVVKRFLKMGFSVEETAGRMDVSIDYIKTCLEI